MVLGVLECWSIGVLYKILSSEDLFRRSITPVPQYPSTPRLWPTDSNALTDGKYSNDLWRCTIGFISLRSACGPRNPHHYNSASADDKVLSMPVRAANTLCRTADRANI